MPDREFQFGRTDGGQYTGPPAAPSLPLPRVVCANCSADLNLLPAAARYCNRCGVSLSAAVSTVLPNPSPAPPRASSGLTFSRPRWLFNLWFACSDCDGPGGGTSGLAGRSAMLLAYGKSLFNLGWRYEHALGARRNLSEAARCYLKAARLGDDSAVGRLTSTAVAALADAEDPSSIPPAAPAPAPALPPLARVHASG